MAFRDYDPQTGRYVQSDPVGLAEGLNTYTYVFDNPLRCIDFFGLWSGDDNTMWGHYILGDGSEFDISVWCSDYLSDLGVEIQQSIVRNKIYAKKRL